MINYSNAVNKHFILYISFAFYPKWLPCVFRGQRIFLFSFLFYDTNQHLSYQYTWLYFGVLVGTARGHQLVSAASSSELWDLAAVKHSVTVFTVWACFALSRANNRCASRLCRNSSWCLKHTRLRTLPLNISFKSIIGVIMQGYSTISFLYY